MSKASFEGSGFAGADRRPDKIGPADPQPLSQECKKVKLAQRIVAARRIRGEHFNAPIFGEPAWEMLLELYIRETSGASSTAADLQSAGGTSSTTASRWLNVLEHAGLVARQSLLINGHSEPVELTTRGRTSLDNYLAAMGEF